MLKSESQKIKVGLVQINSSFSNQSYLPYSVGILQAYTQKHDINRDRFSFLLPIYSRVPVRDAAEALSNADVVAFSTYVWNFKISIEIAKLLKFYNPNVLIIFGGPQVPNSSEQFLRQHPFIDLCCHGEGELVFVKILETLPIRKWEDIPSISFLGQDGTFISNPKAERIKELSTIPSPYLEGIFEPLMQANSSQQWIALWETNRGCPFSCTFCDWGSATQSKVYPFDLDRLYKEIEWFAQNKIGFVTCCDANFGILPRDIDIARKLIEVHQKYGYPEAISIQNTKNATERSHLIQKILADAGLSRGATIAIQTLNLSALKNIKRQNISLKSFKELQNKLTKDGIDTYTDLIFGLPGETYESFTEGVSNLIESGQHNRILLNNLSILPNAEMAKPSYLEQNGIITVESRIVQGHGSLKSIGSEFQETQLLVIATNDMPRNDWLKARVFSWMVSLLYFDKLLQIPLSIIHEVCSLSYRELVEAFLYQSMELFPTLQEIQNFLWLKARDIQEGGEEFYYSEDWLGIWWPVDEYIMIKICIEDKLDNFYSESEKFINIFLKNKFVSILTIIQDAIFINKNLIKQPFQTTDLDIELDHNILEFYQAILTGEKIPLENRHRCYRINRTSVVWSSWEDWCKEVIWYGNKRGSYLYKDVSIID